MKEWRSRTVQKLVLLLVSGSIVLGGCAAGGPKKTIQIRIRRNAGVHAQAANNLATQPTPPPTATTTPQAPEPTASPTAAAMTEPAEVSVRVATPTPVAIPFGRPDRIVIDSVAIDTSVEEVGAAPDQVDGQWFQRWETAAYAAGFHANSALLGQKGNTVISGHNNIDGAVFRNLYQVEPGQVVQTYAGGYRYDYVIEERFLVRERGVSAAQRIQNASWIQTTVDERLTLVSCWPPDGNEYRVIVVAKPVSAVNAGASGGE